MIYLVLAFGAKKGRRSSHDSSSSNRWENLADFAWLQCKLLVFRFPVISQSEHSDNFNSITCRKIASYVLLKFPMCSSSYSCGQQATVEYLEHFDWITPDIRFTGRASINRYYCSPTYFEICVGLRCCSPSCFMSTRTYQFASSYPRDPSPLVFCPIPTQNRVFQKYVPGVLTTSKCPRGLSLQFNILY